MNRSISTFLKHTATDAGRLASVLAVAMVLWSGVSATTYPVSADGSVYLDRLSAESDDRLDDRFEVAPRHGTAWALRGTDVQIVYDRVAERKSGGSVGHSGGPASSTPPRGSAPMRTDDEVERWAAPRPLFYLHSALLI